MKKKIKNANIGYFCLLLLSILMAKLEISTIIVANNNFYFPQHPHPHSSTFSKIIKIVVVIVAIHHCRSSVSLPFFRRSLSVCTHDSTRDNNQSSSSSSSSTSVLPLIVTQFKFIQHHMLFSVLFQTILPLLLMITYITSISRVNSTAAPTATPTANPTTTAAPTANPTSSPVILTNNPTPHPTSKPTSHPTSAPTAAPTVDCTEFNNNVHIIFNHDHRFRESQLCEPVIIDASNSKGLTDAELGSDDSELKIQWRSKDLTKIVSSSEDRMRPPVLGFYDDENNIDWLVLRGVNIRRLILKIPKDVFISDSLFSKLDYFQSYFQYKQHEDMHSRWQLHKQTSSHHSHSSHHHSMVVDVPPPLPMNREIIPIRFELLVTNKAGTCRKSKDFTVKVVNPYTSVPKALAFAYCVNDW